MHIGDIVKKALKEVTSYTSLSKELGISRPTLGKYLKMADMPLNIVIAIGNSIRYDFTDDIPGIKSYAIKNKLKIYVSPDKYFMSEYSKKCYNVLVEYDALREFTLRLCKKHKVKIYTGSI